MISLDLIKIEQLEKQIVIEKSNGEIIYEENWDTVKPIRLFSGDVILKNLLNNQMHKITLWRFYYPEKQKDFKSWIIGIVLSEAIFFTKAKEKKLNKTEKEWVKQSKKSYDFITNVL